MIEKIFVPTLERVPARRYVNLGALVTMGVPLHKPPHEIIKYFPARDAQAYAGNPSAAVEDALREGYRLGPKMIEHWSGNAGVLKWFCMQWTFTMIFQKIMQMPSHQYFMFLVDDYRIGRPFDALCELVGFVHEDAQIQGHPLSILQLDVFDRPGYPQVEHPAVTSFPARVLVRGLSGCGDTGLIVSPAGARILYERMCESGGKHHLEGQLWHMAQQEDQSGFYSISIPHLFIQHIGIHHHMLIQEGYHT